MADDNTFHVRGGFLKGFLSREKGLKTPEQQI